MYSVATVSGRSQCLTGGWDAYQVNCFTLDARSMLLVDSPPFSETAAYLQPQYHFSALILDSLITSLCFEYSEWLSLNLVGVVGPALI